MRKCNSFFGVGGGVNLLLILVNLAGETYSCKIKLKCK